MQAVAIICEYNPFHTGHKYMIEKIRERFVDTAVVCIMSGEFVQRGDVAIIDKHTRASIAVENGADLVLQLPAFFSTQVAEIFARGSISLINSLGCIDYLCFGSDSGDMDTLYKVVNTAVNKEIFKENMKKGNSFAKSYFETDIIKDKSNDILAVEYIRALQDTDSNVKPYAIKRRGAKYNEISLNDEFSSATAIRRFLKEGDFENVGNHIPSNSRKYFDIIKFDDDFLDLVKYAIISKKDELSEIFEIGEGLENRILSKVTSSSSLEDFIMKIKSKRYTYTRIRRILFNILLDIKKSDMEKIKKRDFSVPYARLLAFNDRGTEVIKSIKKSSDIAIINKVANYNPQDSYEKMIFEKDILSTKIYNIRTKSRYDDDFTSSPIYVKI